MKQSSSIFVEKDAARSWKKCKKKRETGVISLKKRGKDDKTNNIRLKAQ